jgi:VIT1/CCC1 family predicted Fe2+/Mn2+ transporter
MKILAWLFQRERMFALLIGAVDGILTALTLAAGRVLRAEGTLEPSLAFRIPTASALSGAFVFFVAEYARQRGELVRAERQLNLTAHGRLATTRLGRTVLYDAAGGAVLAIGFNFLGALIPLLVGALVPGLSWLAVVVAIICLGALGFGIARAIYGSILWWTILLMLAGVGLTLVGMYLNIA